MKNIFSRFKNIFPTSRLSTSPNNTNNTRLHRFSTIFPRVFLFLCVIILISTMYYSLTMKRAGLIVYSVPEFNAGDISQVREIALFDFQVPKSPEQLQQEHSQAIESVLPVFNYDRSAFVASSAEIDSLLKLMKSLPITAVSDSIKAVTEDNMSGKISFSDLVKLKQLITKSGNSFETELHNALHSAYELLYTNLIVSGTNTLINIVKKQLILEEGNSQRIINVEEVMVEADAVELLKTQLENLFANNKLRPRDLLALQDMATIFIRPNLYYNGARTDILRQQAIDAVSLYSTSYKKNERIIESNVPVTALQISALEAYKQEFDSRSLSQNRRSYYAVVLGEIFMGIGIIAIILIYIYQYRRKLFESFQRLFLLVIIASIPISVAYYAAWSGAISEFLIPVTIASILITILFDAELGILISLSISMISASLFSALGMRIGFIYFLAGGVGALTVGRVRHRREFYRSMAVVPVVLVVAVIATNDWINSSGITTVGKDIFLAAINGFFCTIVAIGLLPVLESTFKIVTDITLLELSDLNNPLLKELAVKAPGTFSSVLMVGSLAEAAAEKIGANSLLARVGSYYHDIGKMSIPEYFIENQLGGENPHDRLTPHMSALVIASHVKEGYVLGMKYGLPDAILDVILQHHGTSLMASIYHKAKESAQDEDLDDSSFRYSGPKPQTREAGIVMLADLVEAASRSVRERSPGRLKVLISTIIQKRFTDGELNECDLTLKDINNIEESFMPVLVGSHHGRIAYPWQHENGKGKKVNSKKRDTIISQNPDIKENQNNA